MTDLLVSVLNQLAWPGAIVIAWIAGEIGQRWLSLPRISSYGIAGFLMASSQGGFLPNPSGSPVALLADFAFALILFELGYRINLRWLRANPWIGVTSVLESACTFAAVWAVASLFGVSTVSSVLLAALAMCTSPAAVLRVVNELRSSGQVTERVLHLSAFNCVLAVVVFKCVVGYSMLESASGPFQVIWSSVVVLIVSAGIGALFGLAVPALLRALGSMDRNATVAFAAGALLLTTFTHAFKFSPLLAALVFGLVARHRRVILSQAQRNFGALGDLLTVLLFVFVATSLNWMQVWSGLGLAFAVLAVRVLSKTGLTMLFARASGISSRKGLLTGLAMTPMSVFVILLLEQTRHLNLGVLDGIAGLAAIALLLEVIGPLVTQRALIASGETQRLQGD